MTRPDPADEDTGRLLARAMADEEPPAWLVAAALALGAPRPAADPVRALVRKLAALVQDSWAASPAALGLRGGPDARVRHVLYSVDDRDVDLRLSEESADRWRLAGQVLGPDGPGTVVVARPGEPPRSASLDALGEFEFDGLVPGTYSVTIVAEATEIALPPLDVGAPR